MFQSFFMGGIECSTQRLKSGKRLDLLHSTHHDQFVVQDYRRLARQGLTTVRSGFRWHLIEQKGGYLRFDTALPLIQAARQEQIQVIWDLCHFGWPDGLDIFTPTFVERFAIYARAITTLLVNESDQIPMICPINEISFLAWAGGDVGYLNPFAVGRGFELKAQLVRATIAAIEAIWSVAPHARIVNVDPCICIHAHPQDPDATTQAAHHHLAQYQTRDMLCGRLWPQLGGNPRYLDILGINYYPNNQWIHHGEPVDRYHSWYRPFRTLLNETYARYQCSLFVAETGTEGAERPEWLHYIMNEVRAAQQAGTPVQGVCLYPIFNHPGWDDDRHCHNGLWDYPNEKGERVIYDPLAQELARQQERIRAILVARDEAHK
jgi:beta-glucosidase/6-phospho-beta-glucosidase/beta-galactosidase